MKDVINVGTVSGGGAIGIWAWRSVMGLHNSGYPLKMIGGSSTGCIVAYLYAKGFFDEAEALYKPTYFNNARNIFEPGIAKIEDGKIKFDFWQAFLKVFKIKNVKSLMTNKGLYDTFLALEKKKPQWGDTDMFFNTTSLQTGINTQHVAKAYIGRSEELCKLLVASTSMPGILPWWDTSEYKVSMDGGITEGLPFRPMFMRMDPTRDYRFFNVMCNPIDLLPADQLTNGAQILARTVSVMLNQILKGNLDRTEDKNSVAKIIWPVSDSLEKLLPIFEDLKSMGLTGYSDTLHTEVSTAISVLRQALGYRNMPIFNMIYSGNRNVFEFTPEAYNEMQITAENDIKSILFKLANP